MEWTDEYWPLVIQLYLKKPMGIKPMYSRDSVRLALDIHVPPQTIYKRMFMLRQPPLLSLQQMLERYTKSPRRLASDCKVVRQLYGMGNASAFFDDVKMHETWELDFRPVNARTAQMMGRPLLTPVMLTMILDLYFRLVPTTMVASTPDVKEMAQLLDISASDVEDVLHIFQYCDPFIQHSDSLMDPLLPPCHKLWQRYANADPVTLPNQAMQLMAYFK